jgi:hypothetical protein
MCASELEGFHDLLSYQAKSLFEGTLSAKDAVHWLHAVVDSTGTPLEGVEQALISAFQTEVANYRKSLLPA